jgi:hypothetical protein
MDKRLPSFVKGHAPMSICIEFKLTCVRICMGLRVYLYVCARVHLRVCMRVLCVRVLCLCFA